MQLGEPRLRPTIRLFVIDEMSWTTVSVIHVHVHVNLIRSFITDKNTVKCQV